jgi:tape measure domain-containing protein
MTETNNPNISFKVVSDSSQAQADLKRVDASLNKVENSANSTAAGLVSLASKLATAFAGAAIITGITKTSDAFTNLQNKLKLVTESTQQLVDLQDDLISLANTTRSSVDSTASVYSSFAKSVKGSQKDLLAVSQTVQQAVAMSGATAEGGQAAIFQLSQGLQSGVLRGEELNSVLEQTPALARAIAAGMGKTLGELREAGQAGQLTTSVVYDALRKQASVVNEEFNKTSITIGQANANLAGAGRAVAGEVFTTIGLSNRMARNVDNLSKKLLANKDAIVASASLTSLAVRGFVADTGRVISAFNPLFSVLGAEFERMVPVIKFMRLNVSQIFNIEALVQYSALTRYLADQLTLVGVKAKNALSFLGADFKPDFFNAAREVVRSKSIPQLEANIKSLADVIETPTGLGFFKDFGKALTGDTELVTAMLDAISVGPDNKSFRDFVDMGLEVRQMLASLGLVENKLVVIGNVRTDKLLSLGEYFKEISRVARSSVPYALTESIEAIQRFTLAVGSYFLEAQRNTSGLLSVVFGALGKAAFAMVGFSAATDRYARGIYNTMKGLGLQFILTGALAGKIGNQIKGLFTNIATSSQALESSMRGLGSSFRALSDEGAKQIAQDIVALISVGANSFLFNRIINLTQDASDSFDRLRKSVGFSVNDITGTFSRFEAVTERMFLESLFDGRADSMAKVFNRISREITQATPALERMRNVLGSGLVDSMENVFGDKLVKSSAQAVFFYYDSAVNMLDKIISMTSVKLRQISGVIERFTTKVKALFFDVYDKVVGNSYWPDMIQGIIDWSNRLDKDAFTIVEKFTKKTKQAFESISAIDITDPFGNKSFFSIDEEGIRNGVRILAGAVIIGISTALFSPALFAAMGSFLAFEIAKSVAVSTDKMLGKVFNVSAFEEIGKSVGAAAGALVVSMLKQIPDMFSAIMNFASGFLTEFLNQFGLIGEAIKGIANLVTGGNIGLLPIMLFGASKADGILKSLSSIFGETKKVGDAAKAASGGAGALPSILGKIDTKFAMAAVVALISAVSSEVSIFKASMTAAPLMLVAFLGTDVTGKLILNTISAVLTKVTASIAASTAAGGLIGRILERMFGSNGAAIGAVASSAANRAKKAVETVFGVLAKVTDEENRKAYVNGQKSFTEFAMGAAGDKNKASSASYKPGNIMGAMRFNEEQQERKKTSDAIASWTDKLKSQIKEKGSILKDMLFGANSGGMKSSFADAVGSAAAMAKSAVNVNPADTVINKAVGLNQSAIAANMAAVTSTISSSMTTLAATTTATAGPGGLMSKLMFGKVGTIAAVLLLSNLAAKTAEAGVKDVANKAMDYIGTGLELGFIGAAILGTDAGRKALGAIGGFIGKAIGYLAQLKGIGVIGRVLISIGGAVKSVVAGISAFIGGILTVKGALLSLAGFSLYSIFFGEGDGWLERMKNNLKGILNTLANIAGFNDIWPNEAKMKPLRFATQKSTLDAAKSIGIIDKGLSKQVEERIDSINFSTLTQTQAKQLQSYNKMITEQVTKAKLEIKELGEVQKETTDRIKEITDQQEKMLMKLRKGQTKSVLSDAIKLQTQIEAPTNTKAKEAVNTVAGKMQAIAAKTPLRFFFPSLAIVVNNGAANKSAIDEAVDRVIKRTIVQRNDLKEAYKQVGSDISFAFEKIGDDAPLLDATKYNKPITEMTAAVANSIKKLQDAEEGAGFFAKLGFGASDNAKIEEATAELFKNTKALAEYTKYVRELAQTQSEVNAFQKSITDTETALKALNITANRGDLLSNVQSIKLKNYTDLLKSLENELAKAGNTAEATKIAAQIDIVKVKIANNIDSAEVKGTVKGYLEKLIKDANVSGVDWQQILALKPEVRAKVIAQLIDLGAKIRKVGEIPVGSVGALERSAEQSNAILVSQQAISGVLNSNATAAESFATKMLQGAAASADMLNDARLAANPALASKLKTVFDRQSQRQEAYAGRSKDAPMTPAEAQAIVADQKLIDDTRSMLMGNAAKKDAKTYIDVINERLSKAGASINAEKLFALQPDVQKQVSEYVGEILRTRDKLTKLPVNKATGLPDTQQASALQKKIDDTKTKLDKLATTYSTFDDMVSDKLKLLPDKVSPEVLANLSSSAFDGVMRIAQSMDDAVTRLKFDPSKSLMENFANFKESSNIIRTAGADIAKLIGVSVEDALKALGIDWQDLFGLKDESRRTLMKTAEEILKKEKELEQLRKNPNSSLEDINKAESGLKALKQSVDNTFASYNSLKALGDTFSSGRFFELPKKSQDDLMELGGLISSLDKQLSDISLKSIDLSTDAGKEALQNYAALLKQRKQAQQKVEDTDFLDKSIENMTERLSKLGFNIDPLVIAKLGSDIVDQMRNNLSKLNAAYRKLNNAAPGSPEAKQASNEISGLSEGLRSVERAASEMGNFSNSMVSAGSNFVKGILTNTSGAWSGLLNSVTGTIVESFSNRVGEYLFRDMANSLAGELFGGELGSTAANAMYVRPVDGSFGGSGAEGNPDFVGPPSSAAGGLEKAAGDLGFGGIVNKFKMIFGEKGIFGQLKKMFSGGEGGESLFGKLFSGIKSLFGGGEGGGILSGIGSLFKGIGGLFGFSEGGFTGEGGKFEPKGIVHGGEFVINKEATKRIGLGYLSRLNSFKGYSSGGLVGGVASDSVTDAVRGSAAASVSNQTVNLEIVGDISRQTKAEIYKMLPSIAEGVNAHNREKGFKG